MPINWALLETNIQEYLQRGSGDSRRSLPDVARKIEDLYIREVTSGGRDQYGNSVISLPRNVFSATLLTQFKANLGVEPPRVNLREMYESRTKDIPQTPKVPKKSLPVKSVSLPSPPIPGLPSKQVFISIPQRLGRDGELKPVIEERELIKMSLSSVNSRQPEIPNPSIVRQRVEGVISTTKLENFSVSVPSIPIDQNLLKLNALGTNGVILAWFGARMGIAIPPPGFASVVSNTIVSPGAIAPMRTALGGPKFASEIVNSLKTHAKTVSGLTVGTTPNGAPITVPWVGIS